MQNGWPAGSAYTRRGSCTSSERSSKSRAPSAVARECWFSSASILGTVRSKCSCSADQSRLVGRASRSRACRGGKRRAVRHRGDSCTRVAPVELRQFSDVRGVQDDLPEARVVGAHERARYTCHLLADPRCLPATRDGDAADRSAGGSVRGAAGGRGGPRRPAAGQRRGRVVSLSESRSSPGRCRRGVGRPVVGGYDRARGPVTVRGQVSGPTTLPPWSLPRFFHSPPNQSGT